MIATLDGMTLTLRRRDGTLAFIEFLAAAKSPDFPPIGGGMSITAIGTTDARHTPRQNNHPHHGGKGILAQRSMTGGTIC